MSGSERLELRGFDGKEGTNRTVAVSVSGSDEWVYAERVGTHVEVWTGAACRDCVLSTGGLRRCDRHKNLEIVALQYRFA